MAHASRGHYCNQMPPRYGTVGVLQNSASNRAHGMRQDLDNFQLEVILLSGKRLEVNGGDKPFTWNEEQCAIHQSLD
jgi:hypothetical protein